MLAIVTFIAACTPTVSPDNAELLELANIRESNIVPKTSPTRLVSTFRDYCIETGAEPGRVAAVLKASDYNEVPTRASDPVRLFVVDDTRPAVLVMRKGRGCAVAAESRTGQTSRIERMVASDFPGATRLDPQRLGQSVERAWAVTGKTEGVIFVQRIVPPADASRLILGINHN